jgi:quinol monooxygenase YgiN
METLALLVRLEAKPGKENDVESFLKSGLALVLEEPLTESRYALKFGPSTFGIFDTFAGEDGRDAHLAGKVAEALMANASALLSTDPVIEKVELIAIK